MLNLLVPRASIETQNLAGLESVTQSLGLIIANVGSSVWVAHAQGNGDKLFFLLRRCWDALSKT
jgi:hypothetical protein